MSDRPTDCRAVQRARAGVFTKTRDCRACGTPHPEQCPFGAPQQPIPIPTHANHVHSNVVELLEEYLERARRGEVYAIALVVTDGPPSTTVETRHGRVVGDTCSARVLASALRTRARELEDLEGEPDG